MIDTLCGDCEYKEFKYEYHFPHPGSFYWYCNALKIRLGEHSGVRRSIRCPKLDNDSVTIGESNANLRI